MKVKKAIVFASLLMIAGLLMIIPATAETNTTADITKPSLTVSVIPPTPKVGDIVVISGTAQGGNLTPGVDMWIFAGNYANVTNVPVNASGFYSRSINTADFPPAYYYIFVQHPGSDNKFNINIKGYSGEVVNTNTGTLIFNFTGTGSVHDNAAAIALSTAFNTIGADDIFSKTGVELLPASGVKNVTATTVTTMRSTSPAITTTTGTAAIPSATKAPLSIISPLLGIGLVVTGVILRQKN